MKGQDSILGLLNDKHQKFNNDTSDFTNKASYNHKILY